MCSNAMVVPQLKEIQEDIIKASPDITREALDTLASNAFEQKYFIPVDKATKLWHDQQWDRWLSKHQPEFSRTITSQKIKALDDGEHGRFVEYDLITSDIDRADMSGEQYPDLIPPETISKVEQQLMGSLINVKDPQWIMDYPDVKKRYTEGARFAGIGHEHHFDQDIVPVLEVVKVKALDNNSRLRVTAKLNEYSQRAEDVWQMIKNKTLGYASVEMKELDSEVMKVGNRYVNVIKDMLLGGWTLTSKAVNGMAAQVGCFAKAIDQPIVLDSSTSTEDNTTETKMAEEEIKKEEETPKEEQPVEEKKEEVEEKTETEESPKEEATEAPAEEEKVKALEEKVSVLEEKLKALDADKELADSIKDDLVEKVKASLESESKALVEPEQEKFEEKVKAELIDKIKSKELSLDEKFAAVGKFHNEHLQ